MLQHLAAACCFAPQDVKQILNAHGNYLVEQSQCILESGKEQRGLLKLRPAYKTDQMCQWQSGVAVTSQDEFVAEQKFPESCTFSSHTLNEVTMRVSA